MKVSKKGSIFRLLRLVSGVVLIFGIITVNILLIMGGILGWIGFKIIDEVLNG